MSDWPPGFEQTDVERRPTWKQAGDRRDAQRHWTDGMRPWAEVGWATGPWAGQLAAWSIAPQGVDLHYLRFERRLANTYRNRPLLFRDHGRAQIQASHGDGADIRALDGANLAIHSRRNAHLG